MTIKTKTAAPLAAVLMLLAAAAQAQTPAVPPAATPDSPAAWQALARQDLAFAAEGFRKHHVGARAGHANVLAPLQQAELVGRAELSEVQDEAGYLRLMERFGGTLGDPHAVLNMNMKTLAWTGLMVDHQAGKFRVIWSETSWPTPLPPVGAEVLACDEVWTGSWLLSRVAPTRIQIPEYAPMLGTLARVMMSERGLGSTPAHCDFRLADGRLQRFELPLRKLSEPLLRERWRAALKSHWAEAAPVGMAPLGAGKQLISFPHFFAGDDKSRVAFAQVHAELKQLAGAKRKPAWLVFDLRGNGGGDSSLGAEAIKAFYGEAHWQALEHKVGLRKQYLASEFTRDAFKAWLADPSFAAHHESLARLVPRLEAAVQANQVLVDDPDQAPMDAVAAERYLSTAAPRRGATRVAVLIDRNCFSSCMNFLLHLQAMPGTLVLGEPTQNGWSAYGEIQSQALPSGRGTLFVPIAYFAGGQQRREPFVPQIPYAGNMADSKALLDWVGRQLDGAARR